MPGVGGVRLSRRQAARAPSSSRSQAREWKSAALAREANLAAVDLAAKGSLGPASQTGERPAVDWMGRKYLSAATARPAPKGPPAWKANRCRARERLPMTVCFRRRGRE